MGRKRTLGGLSVSEEWLVCELELERPTSFSFSVFFSAEGRSVADTAFPAAETLSNAEATGVSSEREGPSFGVAGGVVTSSTVTNFGTSADFLRLCAGSFGGCSFGAPLWADESVCEACDLDFRSGAEGRSGADVEESLDFVDGKGVGEAEEGECGSEEADADGLAGAGAAATAAVAGAGVAVGVEGREGTGVLLGIVEGAEGRWTVSEPPETLL